MSWGPGTGLLAAVAGVIGLVGPACTANLDPIEVDLGCPQQPLRGPEEFAATPADLTIDDFEDGDLFLARVAGRNGPWIMTSDLTSTMISARTTARCVARGGQSAHYSGAGMTGWGSQWMGIFVDSFGGPPIPFDGRGLSGISFWAAVARGTPEPYEIPIGLTTQDTIPSPVCPTCMGFFGRRVTLTSAWTRHVIRFADFAQMGNGAPPVMFRPGLMSAFIIWPTTQFDIYIDDIRFEP
jgi:hypothetical protein